MGTCYDTICKHQIFFPSIQRLAWLPQGRPQEKQKCGKNSKNINLCRYFKFNREANCNTSSNFHLSHVYRYIVQLMLHCSLLWTSCLRFLTKSPAIPQQLYKTASRGLSATAELLVLYNHTVTRQCDQCCKSGTSSQSEKANLTLSPHPHPLTDSHQILHMWLRPPYLPTRHIWSSSRRGGVTSPHIAKVTT